MYHKENDIHACNIRAGNQIHLLASNNTKGLHNYRYLAVKIMNILSAKIKCVSSVKLFKLKVNHL